MPKNSALSLRARWLAERLKVARLQAGRSLVEAGEYLQVDHTTLGRFERGVTRVRRAYVRDLLDFYGVSSDRERAYLLRLAEDSWRKDWTDTNSADLEAEFIDLTWLENKSVKIRVFEPLTVHGLLQTPDYSRALAATEQGKVASRDVLDRVAEVRQQRQQILQQDRPTDLTAVLEEPAVRRPVGGEQVLLAQLRHLIDVSSRSNIELRILPLSAPADPGHHGAFTHFEMPDPYPEVAYVESLAGRNFVEDETRVARFRSTYDEICKHSFSPKRTKDFINKLIKELE